MEHPKFCPHCGVAVVGEMKSCTACGESVIEVAPAAPAQPSQKKSASGWVAGAIIIALLWCAWSQVVAPAMRQVEAAKSYDVIYRVTGTASEVDLTYSNVGGDTEQQNDHSVPWYKAFTGHPGQFLYVSAQNQGKSGTVKCEIQLNGTVVKTAESKGAYTIASCSGQI